MHLSTNGLARFICNRHIGRHVQYSLVTKVTNRGPGFYILVIGRETTIG